MSEDRTPAVLITGASSGIGLEFAVQFARRGWTVYATHRAAAPSELAAQAMAELPNILYESMDVSDPESIRSLASRLRDQSVDVLINNAGIAYDGSASGFELQDFGALDPATFHRMFGVNVLGALLVTQEFTEHLRKGTHKKAVSISSTNGSLTEVLPGTSVYYKASKAALNRAMVCAAEALLDDGIAVVLLHPGSVLTEKNLQHGAANYPGLITTRESVSGMIEKIDSLSLADSGKFFLHDGAAAPW